MTQPTKGIDASTKRSIIISNQEYSELLEIKKQYAAVALVTSQTDDPVPLPKRLHLSEPDSCASAIPHPSYLTPVPAANPYLTPVPVANPYKTKDLHSGFTNAVVRYQSSQLTTTTTTVRDPYQ